MARYIVRFMKDVLGENGHEAEICQRSMEIGANHIEFRTGQIYVVYVLSVQPLGFVLVETGSMSGWWVASLCTTASATQW
jgi:hypothetical protein